MHFEPPADNKKSIRGMNKLLFDYLTSESLDDLEFRIVKGEGHAYSFGTVSNLYQHVEMIRLEFVGKNQPAGL